MHYLRFAYGEPACIVLHGTKKYLVVGDLHIGVELRMRERGVRINATEHLAERILRLVKEFSADKLIIIGDVKHSVLYPDAAETRMIKSFFERLGSLDVEIVAGNHDAHLGEMTDHRISKELIIGRFAFMHGHKKPSQEAMDCEYLITAHNHPAIRIVDKNGATYDEKIWVVADVDNKAAKRNYDHFNKNIKLVITPAFNYLVMGRIGNILKRHNQLLAGGIFDYDSAKLYTLDGSAVDRPVI